MLFIGGLWMRVLMSPSLFFFFSFFFPSTFPFLSSGLSSEHQEVSWSPQFFHPHCVLIHSGVYDREKCVCVCVCFLWRMGSFFFVFFFAYAAFLLNPLLSLLLSPCAFFYHHSLRQRIGERGMGEGLFNKRGGGILTEEFEAHERMAFSWQKGNEYDYFPFSFAN